MPPVTMPQSPEYAVLFFNAVKTLGREDFASLLSAELRKTFGIGSTEYVCFSSDELDAAAENGFSKLHEELGRLFERASLIHLGAAGKYLMVFYEAAETLTKERMDGLLRLIGKVKSRYSDVHSLICIDKTECDTEAAMENTFAAAEKLNGRSDASLVLLDVPAHTSCIRNIRCLVRYIHCLSRDNSLGSTLRSSGSGKFLTIAMSEFDVQGYAKLLSRIQELNQELHPHTEFPMGVLTTNFNAIVRQKEEEFKRSSGLFARDIPIPVGVVAHRALFGKKGGDPAKVHELEETLEYTFEKGIWEPYLTNLKKEHGQELCNALVKDIPVGQLRFVREKLEDIPKGNKERWNCSLTTTAYSLEKLQMNIQTQLDTAAETYAKGLPGEILKTLCDLLPKNIDDAEIEKRRGSMGEEFNRLTARKYPNVTNERSYLENLSSIMNDLLPDNLLALIPTRTDTFMLVSNSIAQNWHLYSGQIFIGGIPLKDPYDCGTLDDQEFQVFRMRYCDGTQKDDNWKKVFRIWEEEV